VAAANGIFEFRRSRARWLVTVCGQQWDSGWRKRFQRVTGRNAPSEKDGGGGGEVQKDCIMFALRRGG